ncbi:MAG: hypothetical protein WAL98_10400 [Desulfatiglandaceae bacterium]
MRVSFRPFLIVHLAPNTGMDDYLGFMSPNPTSFYEFTLNPKSASIPSEVFRKGVKKSVRFGSSSYLIGCRSRHKPAFYDSINQGELPISSHLPG